VLVTGDPESDRAAELLSAQDARHLEKPFDTQTLLGVVRDLLGEPAPWARPGAGYPPVSIG